MSDGTRRVPFGLRLLDRTGGLPSALLNMVWILGMVWPEFTGALAGAGVEVVAALVVGAAA